MVVSYTFAGLNMGNYPPTNETGLAVSCNDFVTSAQSEPPADSLAPLQRLLNGYALSAPAHRRGGLPPSSITLPQAGSTTQAQCFDLAGQLPAGTLSRVFIGLQL